MPGPLLIYYVAEQLLTGRLGGRWLHVQARSGIDSTGPGDAPGASPAQGSRSIRPGIYRIDPPTAWQGGQACRLRPMKSPTALSEPDTFTGYRIHAQRLLGCDRAILIEHMADFAAMTRALLIEKGGRLEVRDGMEGNYAERWATTWAETAAPSEASADVSLPSGPVDPPAD